MYFCIYLLLFITYYFSLLFIVTFVHLLYKNIYCFFLSPLISFMVQMPKLWEKNVWTQIKFDSGTTYLPYIQHTKLFMNIKYV